MRKCGCFMAPPAGLKTLKRRRSGLFVRPKHMTQPIHCQKNGRYTISSDLHDVHASSFSIAGTQKAT